MPRITKKDRPLTHAHLAAFEACYGLDPNGRSRRSAGDSREDRWRSFSIAEVRARDFKIDGLKWLKEESLEDDLPEPEELAAEAIAELESAVQDLESIIELLNSEVEPQPAARDPGWLVTSALSDWEIGRREGELPEGWAEATLEEIVVHKLGGEWGEDPEEADGDPDLVRVRVVRGTDFREWERDKGSGAGLRAVKRSSLAKRQLAGGRPRDRDLGRRRQPARGPGGADRRRGPPAGGRAAHLLEFLPPGAGPPRDRSRLRPPGPHLPLSRAAASTSTRRRRRTCATCDFKDFLSGIVLPLPPPRGAGADRREGAES